jgi:hypothetical protein
MRFAANTSASRCAAGTLAAAAVRLGVADAQPRDIAVDAIEFPRVLEQGRVAALAHVGHDVGHDAVDVLVGVPIAPEEAGEFLLEPRR